MTNGDLTRLLNKASLGDPAARDSAMETVYGRLRELASGHVNHHDLTLQPTALIHEAYLRLFTGSENQWGSRGQFYAVAASAMRHVAVDYARKRLAAKRGGGWSRVTLRSAAIDEPVADEELIELHEAIERLAKVSARQAQVVEMRFFGEMTVEQIAEVQDRSPRSVQLDWRAARAWIRARLEEGCEP